MDLDRHPPQESAARNGWDTVVPDGGNIGPSDSSRSANQPVNVGTLNVGRQDERFVATTGRGQFGS